MLDIALPRKSNDFHKCFNAVAITFVERSAHCVSPLDFAGAVLLGRETHVVVEEPTMPQTGCVVRTSDNSDSIQWKTL